MNTFLLRQAVGLSFLAHAALIASLTFSFVPGKIDAPVPRLSFVSAAVPAAVMQPQLSARTPRPGLLPVERTGSAPGSAPAGIFSYPAVYVKPLQSPAFESGKKTAQVQQPLVTSLPKRKDPAIMFHPLLPYHVQLYFKDRQAVHIELEFMIEPDIERRSITVKRKVSSGNLEADLLSARYMQHYLFIQQGRFTPDKWQTVKIDLSTKNDQP